MVPLLRSKNEGRDHIEPTASTRKSVTDRGPTATTRPTAAATFESDFYFPFSVLGARRMSPTSLISRVFRAQ